MSAVAASGLTWKKLRDLKLRGIEDAADGWREASNRADAARVRVANEMIKKLEGTQEGEARDASVRRLKRLSENFQYVAIQCGLARTSLDGLATELRPLQRDLNGALDEAEHHGFTVHEDGSVGYPAAGKEVEGKKPPGGTVSGEPARYPALEDRLFYWLDANPNHAKAQDIADRISGLLRKARSIDAGYAEAIRKLKTQRGLEVTDAMWADAYRDAGAARKAADGYIEADDIPKDMSPAERKDWWEGLSKEQREQYLALHPQRIGNLDGIPADVRDEANRSYLPLLMGNLESSNDEQALTKLQGLQEIDRQLRSGSQPPMYLLGIGNEGNGRAIVSFGNPDTSKNVSAYVPGLGTALDEDFATNDLKRARDTAIGAQKYDPSSASIIWLGYDAPQLSWNGLLDSADVMSKDNAQAGAPAYNSFMSGLDATNQNSNPHLTAIGHSYGSLTVGQAAQLPGGIPGADDIVLVGSPGTGAQSADQLGVGKDHVFVGASENDPVSKLPTPQEGFGVLAAGVPGFVVGDLISDDDNTWFGKDPANEEFGATRFKVDDGPRPLIDGQGATPAHSNYFNPVLDRESADNIAMIVAGRPNSITREEPR